MADPIFLDKPKSVQWAVRLIWISIGLKIVYIILSVL